MEVRGLEHEAAVGRAGEVGEQGEGEEELRKVVDLEVRVEAVGGLVVFSYAFAGVADQSVDLRFAFGELLGNFVGLF